MDVGTLLYEVTDGVAVVQLNRPDRMNTLGGTMKADLERVFFDLARKDDAVRCVVITGVGDRAFCAGADIKERAGNVTLPADYYVSQKYTHDLFRNIENFEKPVVAAINGVALGGGLELALCADIRIASDSARFGLPEAKLGVLPAAGGTQRLPRVVGEAIAKELMFTADIITADAAKDIRLVNRVVPAGQLMESTMSMARRIAAQPPLSLRFIKAAVNTGLQVGMEAGLNYERFAASMVIDSEDRKEGMRAFIEKRPAVFKGR